jgi:hypothetical protein
MRGRILAHRAARGSTRDVNPGSTRRSTLAPMAGGPRAGKLMSMTAFDYIIDIALIAIVLLQIKERPARLKDLLRPLIFIGIAVAHYLKAVPTGGNDVVLELGLLGLGLSIGVASGFAAHMRRGENGDALVRAGWASAALWVVGMGARMAFIYGMYHGLGDEVVTFSRDHAITDAQAWTVALLLMAVAEAAGRLAVVQTRAHRIRRQGGAGVAARVAVA